MTGAQLKIRRKNNFNILREARKLGSFDDFPLLRPEVDPQLHVSVNSVDQPFFLTGKKDMVLSQMSGRSRIVFAGGPVRYFDLVPGEFVYIPAGMPHRVLTAEDGIQVRYKAREPGTETVAWKCANCGSEVHSVSFDASSAPAQIGYQSACEAFNSDPALRKCHNCGTEADPVNLGTFRWPRVVEALLATDDNEAEEFAH